MGTVLYEDNNLNVKRFYAGEDKGLEFQVTMLQDYTHLTKLQMIRFIQSCIEGLDK